MVHHLRPPALASALLAASLAACTTISAGGFGTDPSRADMEGAPAIALDHDVAEVWPRTKEMLAHLSTRVPRYDEVTRRAFATVDEGAVVAEVLETEPGRSRLAVKARRYGREDEVLARSVISRIERDLER